MEFLECGDLGSLMKEEELTESDAKSVTVQVLEGLEIMHQNNLCHRDLKPGNILIARWMPLKVKIADFGVSKHFDGITEGRTFTGSQKYMAPEIWGILQSDTSTYTTAVDVWSLGCMVYAMLTKEPPFPEPRGLIDYVESRVTFPPRNLQNVSPLAVEFMASLLMPLPADRVTAEQARQHSWISVDSGDDTVWTMLPSRRSSRVNSFPAKTGPLVPVIQDEEEDEDKTVLDPYDTFLSTHKSKLPSNFKPIQVKALPKQPQAIAIAKPTRKGKVWLVSVMFSACDVPANRSTVGPKEDAMIAAAANGNFALVRSMLDRGADLNSLDYQGRTALIFAALGNHLALVQFLVERGAPVSQGNEEGITPLHTAAEEGHLATMEFLLAHGASVNEMSLDGRDPLYFAGISGNLECVMFLLKNGADMKHRTAQGFNALHTAVERAHIAVADYLIQLGFDVMEESVDGRAALDFAVLSNNEDIVKFLVNKGADVSHRDHLQGITALQRVAQVGHLPSAVYLLQNGGHVNEMTPDGRTPLYFACASKNVELVRYLLQKEANIRDRTDDGYTSLHRAAESGDLPIIKYVLEQGVDVMEPSNDNRSPLYFATLSGNVSAVLLLLEKGADIRCVTNTGQNCLMVAAARGHIPMIDFYLSQGFGIDERDNSNYNALHFAAENGELKAVQHLIAKGANIMSTIITGATALSLAGEKGHSEIVTYILERLETGNTAMPPPPIRQIDSPRFDGYHPLDQPYSSDPILLSPPPSIRQIDSPGFDRYKSRAIAPYSNLKASSSVSVASGWSSVNSQAGMSSSVGSASSKKSRKGLGSMIKSLFG
jgi:ankyrin repeat protein